MFASVVYLSGVLGWEFYVARVLPHFSVKDSYERWAKAVNRSRELGPCAVILIGDSRLQMAVDLDAMALYAPSYPVQLSVYGGHYLRLLEWLASDERITGTVIASISPARLSNTFDSSFTPIWVHRFANEEVFGKAAAYDAFEQRLTLLLDDNFNYRQEGASPVDVLRDLNINRYTYMDGDRRIFADFSLIDEEAAYASKLAEYIGSDPKEAASGDLDAIAKRTAAASEKIQGRGGSVVLFRPPSSRGVLEGERLVYPRGRFWDELAAQTAARAIHFEDYPQLSSFHLPDGVHHDHRDAAAFTEALSRIVFVDEELRDRCGS